jgi:hypothetical protein
VPDLESVLLSAVLGFARSRLEALVSSVATDAASLLSTLLPAATQAQREAVAAQAVTDAVTSDLTAARSHLAALGTELAAPPQNLADAAAALADLAAALAALHQAVTEIATVVPAVGTADAALLTAVTSGIDAVGTAFSGLAADLGLAPAGARVADGLTSAGQVLSYQLTNAAERPLPGPAGSALTLSASSLTATLDYGANPPALALALKAGLGVGLVADGLVAQLFSAGTASAALTVTLDTSRGLAFQAGVKGRADLDGAFSVPGVELRELGLEVPAAAPMTVLVSGTVAGALGPVQAVIQGAGVGLAFDPAALLGGGQAATVAIAPPTGAGLTVDVGIVHGGGFLTRRNPYAGVLDLRLGPIEITAIGQIDTDPFSLVMVLAAEFTPAIQLSFGFTLNAVGGLLALARAVATDVLRARLHDHTADTLLFPADPVAAAPTILDLLADVFPVQRGGFVVGPLIELGWGAPVSYVTAKLGVVIALPDPKVILIGAVRVAVPLPDAAIVDLRAELYGEITPDHLLFLVSLSGSNVAGFSVAGDFGLLIGFGADPEFAFSAGGFHPHYRPPGELAGMRRVSVDLSPPAQMTLRSEAYLALTSNSFQLGCRVELRADVAGVGAEGHLAFDALVRWAPAFRFEIDLDIGVSLFAAGQTFAGVDLRLHLEGPGRWLAHGTASVSLLFFDVSFEVGPIPWGSGDESPADPVSPQQLVHDKLSLPAAWAARLPPDSDTLVRLAALPDGGAAVVHPLGVLEARQQAVPLELTLDRIGRNPVTVSRVNLGAPTVGGLQAQAVSDATDLFAPGEFLNLSDDEEISRPAFEPRPAGLALAGAQTALCGNPSSTSYEWDTVFPPDLSGNLAKFTSLKGSVGAVLAAGPAAITATPGNPYAAAADPIVLADPGQARVRSVRDLSVLSGVTTAPMTTADAARLAASIGASAQYVTAGVGA